MTTLPVGKPIHAYLRALGYREHFDDPVTLARAHAIQAVFTRGRKHVYASDRIAGSLSGLFATDVSDADLEAAKGIAAIYEHNDFWTNFDHFAGDYADFLTQGVEGILRRIDVSLARHVARASRPRDCACAGETCLLPSSAAAETAAGRAGETPAPRFTFDKNEPSIVP